MEKWSPKSKLFRFFYQQIFLRFTGQIREPHLVRVDKVFPHSETNELSVSFHIANKRVNQVMTVAEFVKTDMIYLVDPRVLFDIGQQFGAHTEQLAVMQKKASSLKTKCVVGLKRVFVDE